MQPSSCILLSTLRVILALFGVVKKFDSEILRDFYPRIRNDFCSMTSTDVNFCFTSIIEVVWTASKSYTLTSLIFYVLSSQNIFKWGRNPKCIKGCGNLKFKELLISVCSSAKTLPYALSTFNKIFYELLWCRMFEFFLLPHEKKIPDSFKGNRSWKRKLKSN